jgi:C4-type Zn-finger protein
MVSEKEYKKIAEESMHCPICGGRPILHMRMCMRVNAQHQEHMKKHEIVMSCPKCIAFAEAMKRHGTITEISKKDFEKSIAKTFPEGKVISAKRKIRKVV